MGELMRQKLRLTTLVRELLMDATSPTIGRGIRLLEELAKDG